MRGVTRNSTRELPRSIGAPNIPVTLGRRGNPAVIHRRSARRKESLSLSYATLWCNQRRRKRNRCVHASLALSWYAYLFTCRNSVTDCSRTVRRAIVPRLRYPSSYRWRKRWNCIFGSPTSAKAILTNTKLIFFLTSITWRLIHFR